MGDRNMYQVALLNNNQQIILRPELEAADAIYWVNRLSALGYQADVVRTSGPESSSLKQETPELTIVI